MDNNNSNNAIDNLIVLCHDCHSKVTGNAGLGHKYTIGELKKYKNAWEGHYEINKIVRHPVIKYKKELISQIDLIICEILATKDQKRIKVLLRILFELHLYRGSSELNNKIVEGLGHLALMAGLSSAFLSIKVAQSIWEMCFHFVGPHEVPINKSDKTYIINCLDALETLGEFSSGFLRKISATEKCCQIFYNFLQLSIWYDWKLFCNKVINAISIALDNCSYKGVLEFQDGNKIIKQYISKMLKYIRKEEPKWETQLRKLNSLC